MFERILIANRGEIAVRIIRACKELGIETVAVYSQADRGALHTVLADKAVCIGPAEASQSYLDMEKIVGAALAVKANAIHPGYGFLSENAEFAELCRKNGIVFIGPSPEEMARLGDKAKIKKLAAMAGLDVIPGSEALDDVEEAVEEAERIGYPVMLKARSGGGGRGIRLVYSADELRSIFPSASQESEAAFGDPVLYLEKFISPARHIEVQVLADEFGTVRCLGERDCSIQRKHQKLMEESPSPAIDEESRRQLMERVSQAVAKIGYTGAGTLEFLYDSDGRFWFLEMNLRLQVEHGVTEILTGIDLVKWQIRIAAGIPISFAQDEVRLSGYAIECRINALSSGRVSMLHVPGGPFVRFDTYLEPGTFVPPFYDSLVGKLIVYTKHRDSAIRKLKAYLCELVIDGVDTNIESQLAILSDDRFASGRYDTSFLEEQCKL